MIPARITPRANSAAYGSSSTQGNLRRLTGGSMNSIVINLIADAIEIYGVDIRPLRETFHKSAINYGDCVVLYFYHAEHIRRTVWVK